MKHYETIIILIKKKICQRESPVSVKTIILVWEALQPFPRIIFTTSYFYLIRINLLEPQIGAFLL